MIPPIGHQGKPLRVGLGTDQHRCRSRDVEKSGAFAMGDPLLRLETCLSCELWFALIA